MGLFNIDNILNMTDKETYGYNTFSNFTYKNTNFLENTISISNNIRKAYHQANINLHKNSLNENKVKYSDFYNETGTILNEYSRIIKDLRDKALDQYSHYTKEYNLAELSLVDQSFVSQKIPSNLNNIHNYSLMSIGEDFKNSLPNKECSIESLKESIAICKRDGKSVLCGLRSSYGTDSFDVMYMDKKSDVDMSDFIHYMDTSYFDTTVGEVFNVPSETIVSFAKRINNDDLTDTVVREFDSVFEDMQIGSDAILNLINDEIASEAVPYLTPTEEETKGLKNLYTNINISQFIESMCISIIAAGYKADVLFENLIIYSDICDKAKSRVKYLKESGKIDMIDIFLAEAAIEEE